MITIKRIYDPADPNDGARVLVDRLWPRGVSKEKAQLDEWLKEIAPSEELREWFNHEVEKWPQFQQRYQKELAEKPELLQRLREWEKQKGKLTLLFGAKDEQHNNAVVLKQVLEQQ